MSTTDDGRLDAADSGSSLGLGSERGARPANAEPDRSVEPSMKTPRDFGAVGDGVTDDHAAVQDALLGRAESGRDYSYPPDANTPEQRHRFDLCVARASELFEEPASSETVWSAARSMFRSDIPTAPPGEAAEPVADAESKGEQAAEG